MGDDGLSRLARGDEGLRRGGESSDSDEYRRLIGLLRVLPLGLAVDDLSLPREERFLSLRAPGVTLLPSRDIDLLLGDLPRSDAESDSLPLLDPELWLPE